MHAELYQVTKTVRILVVAGLALMSFLCMEMTLSAQESHKGHDHAAHAHEGPDHAGHAHEVAGNEKKDDHAGHDHAAAGHGKNDEHAGHDHGEHGHEENGLRLTPEQHKRFGIVVESAGSGSLRNEVSLPGEIVFNEDRVVHMVPRVAGIARDVRKSMGDRVKAGEILAVIESRELADAKSEFLAARARAGLIEKLFAREKVLHEKKVSSEQDFLEAEQGLAEARIGLRSAEQKLHALGLDESAVKAIEKEDSAAITRYEIRAPIDGVVTEKHVALGESLGADAAIFTLVDTRSVWVNLAVYARNLEAIRVGQDVQLHTDYNSIRAQATVTMVTPFVDNATRTATARVVLDNSDARWLPGTFVTGFIASSVDDVDVVVPRVAVQNVDGKDVVFVEQEGRFEPRPVTLGRRDGESIEIVAGLASGTRYVVEGAFNLKATIVTSSFSGHAGHGH